MLATALLTRGITPVILGTGEEAAVSREVVEAAQSKAAADQAVRLLEQVAAGVFNIEEPDSVTTETTSAPRPRSIA